MKCPPGLNLVKNEDLDQACVVVARVPYRRGDTIFVGKSRRSRIPVSALDDPIRRCGAAAQLCTTTRRLGDIEYIDIVPSRHCATSAYDDVTDSIAIDVRGFDTFARHSCDPNARIEWLGDVNNVNNVNNIDYYACVAARDIAPQQELTIHYDDVYYATAPRIMVCSCGSTACRGAGRYGRRSSSKP